MIPTHLAQTSPRPAVTAALALPLPLPLDAPWPVTPPSPPSTPGADGGGPRPRIAVPCRDEVYGY